MSFEQSPTSVDKDNKQLDSDTPSTKPDDISK